MFSVIHHRPHPLDEAGFSLHLLDHRELPGKECWPNLQAVSQVGKVVLFPAPVTRGPELPAQLAPTWAAEQAQHVLMVAEGLVHLITSYSNEKDRVLNYAGAVKKLGLDASKKCSAGCNAVEALHSVANERRLGLLNRQSEDTSFAPQAKVLLKDVDGYEVLFSLGLERVWSLSPSQRAELMVASEVRTGLERKDAICRALFGDLVALAENHAQSVVLVARKALPSLMLPFFGIDRVAAIIVPGEMDASAGHLKNLLSSAEIPAVYDVFTRDYSELLGDAFIFVSRGEACAQGEVTVHVSKDSEVLRGMQRRALSEHVIELPRGPFVNALDDRWEVGFEVDTFRGLSSVAPYEDTPIELVKLEYLLSEVAGQGKHLWDLSQDRLVSIFSEFLKQSGPSRRVTFRLVDPIPEESTDKPSVPENKRADFLKTQVRAITQCARATGRAIGLMIPNFQSVSEWNLIHALIRRETSEGDKPADVKVIPMIESRAGRKQVQELLSKGHVSEVALGLGDLFCNLMNMGDRESPSIKNPAEAVVHELRKIKEMCRQGGTRLTACGMLATEPAVLIALQASGITSVTFQPANFTDGVEVIKKLDPDECKRVVSAIMSGERQKDRVSVYEESMNQQQIRRRGAR